MEIPNFEIYSEMPDNESPKHNASFKEKYTYKSRKTIVNKCITLGNSF